MAEKVTLLAASMSPRASTKHELCDLLLHGRNGLSRFILQPQPQQQQHFQLIVCEINGAATTSLTLNDAAERLLEALQDSQTLNWSATFADRDVTYVAILLPSISPAVDDGEDGARWERRPLRLWQQRPSSSVQRVLLGMLGVILLALTGYLFFPAQDEWVQYPVTSSIGPRYNYLLTPSNITAWATKHYDPTKYYVRLDEQALVPIELLDEQEERYQAYLAERYPEKAEMAESGAFFDPHFFDDPNNFMLPTDMEFHHGHCIRTLRRYWQAKETGRHVCPWDVDYRHIHHCFTMLEKLMMVPGPRDQGEGAAMSMSWRTKVCDWEASSVM